MKVFDDMLVPEVVNILRCGGVGVIRTDTLYGLVACAKNQSAVERIFTIKRRSPNKPVLVLINDESDLLDDYPLGPFMGDFWPGKNTIILPSTSNPDWITRGTQTIAYRLPADTTLRELIRQTGPLVAPSANPEGERPATTVQDAIDYFSDQVDFYVDGGEVTDQTPSRLLRPLPNGTMERLR